MRLRVKGGITEVVYITHAVVVVSATGSADTHGVERRDLTQRREMEMMMSRDVN